MSKSATSKLLCSFTAVLYCLTIVSSAYAGEITVSADMAPQYGTIEDVFTLSITVEGEGAQDVGAPEFKSTDKFQIQQAGQSANRSIINGNVTSSVTYKFQIFPSPKLKPGTYILPRGVFTLPGGKSYWLKEMKLNLSKVSKSKRKQLGIDFTQMVDNPEPYLGQQVLYRAEVISSSDLVSGTVGEIDFPGILSVQISDPSKPERRIGIGNSNIYTVREALFPTKTGLLKIPPRSMSARIRTPTNQVRHRRSVFPVWPGINPLQTTRTTTKRLVAPELQLNVKALPPAPISLNKYIPVGQVDISASIDRWSVKEGESATWTITITGDANLNPLELPPADVLGGDLFKLYYDSPETITDIQSDRVISTKLYRIAVVPKRAGSLSLPELPITTFDPNTGTYKVLQPKKLNLSVLANPNAHKLLSSITPILKQDPKPINKKQEVALLSEDLFEQHIGPHTFAHAPSTNPIRSLSLIILLPLIALGWRYYQWKQTELEKDPQLVAQRNALRNAQEAVKQALAQTKTNTTYDTPAFILSEYLGNKFCKSGRALTATEACDLLSESIKDKTLISDFDKLFRLIDRSRYGTDEVHKSSQQKPKDLLNEVNKIIEQIDKAV